VVFQLQYWGRTRLENLIRRGNWILIACGLAGASTVYADTAGVEYLKESSQLYRSGNYFRSARYAFAAVQADPSVKAEAYGWITMGLLHAGLPNAASYFFIRTLQTGNGTAIRSVLTQTQQILMTVGADLFRKYLNQYTRYEQYDSLNQSAYLYALGKDALLSGDSARAIGYFNSVHTKSPFWPFALQLRATAYAIQNKGDQAIQDFKECASKADDSVGALGDDKKRIRQAEREADDLRSRCIAGEARTLYQMERFEDAERVYDSIPKKSFVWPDILFEQAWNAFARTEYNRTLGKLVSYKSPALSFMFNSEIEVLKAQTYLALCLYSDANEAINEFNTKYTSLGEEVKEFVERNSNDLVAFYDLGKSALRSSLYTKSAMNQLANRFVRGPGFQSLVATEAQVASERDAIRNFDTNQAGVPHNLGAGFPGFLEEVLRWRVRTVQLLGGAFVKNSLLDYHAVLIDDYEKMAFIKLDMLKRAKDKLMNKHASNGERNRGNAEPSRKSYQYEWGFNGEFWNDELGDYVFGLESECKG
jgi:tetratricopeptide (TPR) repeat protein